MTGIQSSRWHRKSQILDGGLKAADPKGYRQITQKDIAAECGMSTGSITYHFYNMDNFRKELMEHAIKQKNLIVIGQGIAAQDPLALAAPETLRNNALAALAGA